MNRTAIILAMILVVLPSVASAQSVLQSGNYKLDSINFGSSIALVSQQDGIPPSISSARPTITNLTDGQVTITWDTDKASSSAVEYGLTADYTQETKDPTLTSSHSVTVTGLVAETTYHYRVKATDALGFTGYSGDFTFTTLAKQGISSISVSDVSYTTALVSWTTGNATNEELEYGPTTSYGSAVKSNSLGYTTNHTVKLSNLKPGTTYHFKIVATTAQNVTSESSDFIFTTIPNPDFGVISVSLESANTVAVVWSTNTETSAVISYYQDGATAAPLTAGSNKLEKDHSVTLSGLFGDTSYKFSITATDAQGKQITSREQSFKTPIDRNPPIISSLKVNVSRSSSDLILTATWTTDEPSTTEGELESKINPGDVTKAPVQTGLTTDHTIIKTGIQPSTPYQFTAISIDKSGNKSQQAINFVTPALQKGIIALILDSILQPFGWVGKVFGGS